MVKSIFQSVRSCVDRGAALLPVILSSALVLSAEAAPGAAAPRANIIIILVDDMGFSDLGCYGSEIPTPNLDKLAAGGLRFTQFYNTGRCCPTRAALLTGLYPHQAGVGHMTEDRGAPGYRGRLNDSCVTIAEVLKPAGYFTAMTGKWHVGQNHGVTPWDRGFERNLTAAAGGFYLSDAPNARLFLNGQAIANDDPRLPKNWYSTDLWTAFGLKFIDEALAAKKPFFLYLAHNAPHFPLQAPAEDIAKFRGRYKAGWDAVSQARLQRQLEMGLMDKAWLKSPRPEKISQWDKLSDAEKDHFDHLMAVYAAVVHRMDRAVGDLVEGLKQRGVLDNTLIFFLSDNGGNAESGPNGRSEGDPSKAGSTWFCGESWAYVENTPFRLYKHYNHEGGVATPLIVHWPQGISARGELRHQPGHLVDLMATCVEVAGASYPTQFKDKPILPMEGRSLIPAFANQPIQRDALYWEHEGNAAIRVGDLKLVRLSRAGAWELYNLKADRTEQHNLASKHPDKVEELAGRWEAWAKRANVIPYPAPPRAQKNPARKTANRPASSTQLLAGVQPALSRAEIEAGLKSHDRALYIKEGWIRDPYLKLGPDDYYYLTGTTINERDSREQTDPYNIGLGETSAVGATVRLWRSRDLIEWHYLGVIFDLAKDSVHAPPGDRVWAPELHWVPDLKRWALVHCPKQKSNLALSAGPEPKGPWFHPMGTAFAGHHDPSLFQDGGTWWVLWENTLIRPLAADWSKFAGPAIRIDPAGSRTNVLGQVKSVIGHEGATLLKIGSRYVHLGTAWSTDQGRKGSYNLYYCVSEKITGPYGPRRFAGRFLGHGTPFQTRDGNWWCTAFFNANVPPLPRDGIETRDLSETAQTINPRGTTIVPLEVKVLPDGDIFLRAKDPAYATPGPDEVQKF